MMSRKRARLEPSPPAPSTSLSTSHAKDATMSPWSSSSKPGSNRLSVEVASSKSAAGQVPQTPRAPSPSSSSLRNACLEQAENSSPRVPRMNALQQSSSSKVPKTRSWYGSWPRVPKSIASTKVAHETIMGGTLKSRTTADFSRFDTKKSADAMSLSDAATDRAEVSDVGTDTMTTTTEHRPNINPADEQPALSASPRPEMIGSCAADQTKRTEAHAAPTEPVQHGSQVVGGDGSGSGGGGGGIGKPGDAPAAGEASATLQPTTAPSEEKQRVASASSWLGWITGRPAEPLRAMPKQAAETKSPSAPEEMEVDSPPSAQPESHEQPQPPEPPLQLVEEAGVAAQSALPDIPANGNRSSWFGFWSGSAATTPQTGQPAPAPAPPPVEAPAEPAKEREDVPMTDAPPVSEAPQTSETPKPTGNRPKSGSTWAFWSRESSTPSSKRSPGEEEQGQLAVMGESSESHPQKAKSIDLKDRLPKEPPLKLPPEDVQAKAGSKARDNRAKDDRGKSKELLASIAATQAPPKDPPKKSKRGQPLSVGTVDTDSPPSRPATPQTVTGPAKPTPAGKPSKSSAAPTKIPAPNLLLPAFKNTYRLKENPSILRHIASLLLRTEQSPANHVFLAKDPTKIKKAVAIGIHGLFPANYLRPMIGQPTGTSAKFANHAAEAVRRWCDGHGSGDCVIEKVALEGEGRIADRVENLWKLLLNWIDQLRSADLVVVACHSQGVPVGVMLLAKLIELGAITTAKVGVCAMAGVSLGPFPDYRSSMGILMGSAAELWEFADPNSEISKRLEASTRVILEYGVRVTYVGSIDDQVVPMESAFYSPVNHPYIYRAVFINGRIHAPDFIAHLVAFALKLRNMGVSDHGLVRELSTPLAGSLYSGEGHSRLYEDDQVYDLALAHTLETTDVPHAVPCTVQKFEGLAQPNPYHLPWVMRGLLEEDFVKTELSAEMAELLRQFDDWKPVTKALKDVRYRLEVVRSKI